jgi:gliding motility-associated-like protein
MLLKLKLYIILANLLFAHSLIAQKHEQSSVFANNDRIVMFENASFESFVLQNDYGLTGGIKSFQIVVSPASGTAVVTGNNSIIYTPNRSFFGNDCLQYEVCNVHNDCAIGSVDIIVHDFDYMPVAVNDTFTVDVTKRQLFNVLLNDVDLYDIPLKLSVIRDFTRGNSIVTADLKIETSFSSYFTEPDSLIYSICDNEGDCAQAQVFIVPQIKDESNAFIPSAFSPNNDGLNDSFYVPEFKHQKLAITVFNRNGIIVFSDDKYNNNWNGIGNRGPFISQEVPTGAYYYVIEVEGMSKQITGSLYLLR